MTGVPGHYTAKPYFESTGEMAKKKCKKKEKKEITLPGKTIKYTCSKCELKSLHSKDLCKPARV